jgi:hypothetical protein
MGRRSYLEAVGTREEETGNSFEVLFSPALVPVLLWSHRRFARRSPLASNPRTRKRSLVSGSSNAPPHHQPSKAISMNLQNSNFYSYIFIPISDLQLLLTIIYPLSPLPRRSSIQELSLVGSA